MKTQQLLWGVLAWFVVMCWGYCQSSVPSSEPASTSADQTRKQADDRDKTPPTRPRYYDQRERASASLTFEWEFSYLYKFTRSYLESQTGSSAQPASEGELEQPLLQGVLRTSRLPRITHIRKSQEIPHLTNGAVRKADELFRTDFYYLGETGEILLYASRGNNGSVRSVSIVAAGTNGLGLRPPFPNLSLGELVFLVGVSPLRLMDAESTDWKLREVNEQEWVFELRPDEQMKARMPWLRGGERIVVHLNRQKGDAPAKMEITHGSITETWQTLAYKQAHGTWAPEQVLLEYRSSNFEMQSLYRLKEVSRTASVMLDIPRGVPVMDWRWRERALWIEGPASFAVSLSKPGSDLANVRSLEWGPELENSLWRDLRKYQGNGAP
ncbi:MAG: hypothetical protein NZM10_02555 [Fimbriimonadales bacterium]|nr:hypothetical protein [Fimbriimonadales bacterium]